MDCTVNSSTENAGLETSPKIAMIPAFPADSQMTGSGDTLKNNNVQSTAPDAKVFSSPIVARAGQAEHTGSIARSLELGMHDLADSSRALHLKTDPERVVMQRSEGAMIQNIVKTPDGPA